MPTPFYEEGRYRAEVVNQALGKNQNTGTPQFVLRVRVLHRLLSGQEESVRQQYERTIYMYLTDKAAPYTIEKLQGIGFAGSSLRELDLSHATPHDFRGKLVEVDCKWEDRNGEEHEKWDLAWAGNSDIEIAPLEASEARKLDALFGKSLSSAKPKAQPKPAPVAVEEREEITDDDIPF